MRHMHVEHAQFKPRMRGPNLALVMPQAEGIRMFEAVRAADKTGLVLPSSRRLDRALAGSEEWREIMPVFSCWSGTMAAYDEPNKALGKVIQYLDVISGLRYVFKVPQRYRGMKDVVLLADHPGFTLEPKGRMVFVNASRVGVVEEFPAQSERWYLTDKTHGIPQGEVVSNADPKSRHLWRMATHIGLIVRDCSLVVDDGRRFVHMEVPPSLRMGMAVEAPEDIADVE